PPSRSGPPCLARAGQRAHVRQTRRHTSCRAVRCRSMSQSLRPNLAALIGAATLSAATPAAAEAQLRDGRSQLARDGLEHGETHERHEAPFDAEAPFDGSLRAIIETRIEAAERERRYGDIDELTTLWLTLARREQLDRVVERGEQFLNVALKN